MRYLVTAIAAIALVVGAAPAGAAKLCVNPNKANCFATIQAAEDAAADGDRISIARGVYFENVVVDVPNLEISGTSRTIVDPDDPNNGPGFTFMAPGFEIRGFTIRNGDTDAIRVEAAATGGTIRNMDLSGPESDCIETLADFTTIQNNYFMGCGSNFVRFTADDIVIEKNRGKFADSDGFSGTGNRAVVENNYFQNVEDSSCARITGDDLEFVNNHAVGCDGRLIDSEGDNPLIDRNRGEMTEEIETDGANPTVTNNRIIFTEDEGYRLTCSGCAAGGTVSNNRVTYTGDGENGFEFNGDLSGLTIENNRASYTTNNGFFFADTTSNFMFLRNRADDIGADRFNACFRIQGTGHTSERNRATGCHGGGFTIDGDDHSSDGDDVRWTAGSGFLIGSNDATDNLVLLDARVRDVNATGYDIRNNATNTVIENPRASGDVGQNLCDEGAGTTFNGNDLIVEVTCRIVN